LIALYQVLKSRFERIMEFNGSGLLAKLFSVFAQDLIHDS